MNLLKDRWGKIVIRKLQRKKRKQLTYIRSGTHPADVNLFLFVVKKNEENSEAQN